MNLRAFTFRIFCLFFVSTLSLHAAELERLLSIGASVSNHKMTPGNQIAQAAGLHGKIQAVSGGVSNKHYNYVEKHLQPGKSDLPDVIIGVDFFFHDFGWGSSFTEKDRNGIDHYVSRFTTVAQLVVIGNVPQVFGDPEQANQYLVGLEGSFANLLIVDLASIYKDLHSRDGFHYTINGADFYVKSSDVMLDWVHPNNYGCSLIANVIVDQIQKKYPGLYPELKYIPIASPIYQKSVSTQPGSL